MEARMTDEHPKVLVVDDSQATLNLISGYLNQLDVQVFAASSVTEALALARINHPDLVLCDIVFPESSGYEFVDVLRADETLADTPIVLMTGVSALQDRLRAVNSGADDLLTKPFDKAELTSRVKTLLRLKKREDTIRRANVELRERMRLMSTLFLIGNQLRDSLDPADIYRVIREALTTIVGVKAFSIYLRLKDSVERFDLVVMHGLKDTAVPEQIELTHLHRSILSQMQAGKPFFNQNSEAKAPQLLEEQQAFLLPVFSTVPLISQKFLYGLINVHAYSGEGGEPLDFDLITLLSSQVAGALHAVRMHNQIKTYADELEKSERKLLQVNHSLERQMFHLHTLMLFSAQLHSTVYLPKIYDYVRDLAINFIGIESFFILYRDDWGDEHSFAGVADGVDIEPREISEAHYETLIPIVEQSGQSFFRVNPGSVFEPIAATHERMPVACIPMKIEEKSRGVFVIESMLAQKTTFTQQDYELLALLTREAATSIHNGHLHRRVEQLSVTDGLTRVYNRRYFDQSFPEEIKRSERYEHPLSLIMCDIDDFKKVNDEYGHLAGDDVLREIARRISTTLRDIDLVTRFGGEEFALILPDTTQDSALVAAERIREVVADQPVVYEDSHIQVTLSLGVASFPEYQMANTLIAAADKAMYLAKISGKNQVRYAQLLADDEDR